MFRSILLFSLILLMSGGAIAGIIKVPENYATIQAGINAAFPGDTVLVADGTYYENIDFKGKAITVASHFLIDGDTTHVNSTIIDGSKPTDPNKGSVVSFVSGEDTTSVICGFTISGGNGTWYSANSARTGGGIYCFNSGCMIVANKITNNSTTGPRAVGGGLAAQPMGSNAWVVLKGNQITNNSIKANSLDGHGGGLLLNCNARLDSNLIAYNTCIGDPNCPYIEGGGIACQPGSIYNREIVMVNNIISHNSLHSYCTNATSPAAYGGGVHITRCNGRLIGNEISHNETWDYSNSGAGAAGVAVGHSPDSFLIERNIISENAHKQGARDYYGGGLHLYGTGIISMINNLITGNSATYGGGVVDAINTALSGRVTFVNNTIINNIATYGGGIYFHNTAAQVMNTIIWGNQAPTNAAIHSLTSTIYVAYSDVQGTIWPGTGNINSDPQFVTGSAQLAETSPCLGAGIASFNFGTLTANAPDTDILGNNRPRPSHSRPDIGAFEHERSFPKRPHFVEVPDDYPTIQAGINAASPGDTVLVAAGTYYENIDFKGKPITVASHFFVDGDTTHINNTIIDGSKPSHADSGSVVYFISGEDTTSVLCGFMITGGTGTEITNEWDGTQYFERAGGGILCYQSGARIVRNRIIENAVYSPDKEAYGGGVAAEAIHGMATVILQDNYISRNAVTADLKRAYNGGVGLSRCHGIVRNNRIEYNSVVAKATPLEAFAGGLACYADSLDRRDFIIESNAISYNSVTSYNSNTKCGGCLLQGGIRGRFSMNQVSHNELWPKTSEYAIGAGMWILQVPNSFVFENNTIRENAVKQGNGHGGGVAIGWYSSLPVTNNIIEGNSATNGGGLFIHSNSSAQIINNTIIDNKATEGGGFVVYSNSAVYLMNTILWNNQAPTHAAIHIESGTVNASYCDIQGGWSGTMNINTDPLFMNDKCYLADNSPCVDKGNPDPAYNDPEDASNPGFALFPARGTLRNDLGAFGGPGTRKTITSVKQNRPTNDTQPNTFVLFQNYPNPFNPSTTIEFALPQSAFITLKVYNLLGEEVATLVAEQRSAGIHRLNWDARGLASGVYLYRLEAGEFVQSKKLILMR